MTPIDIKSMDMNGLKALAYDVIVEIERQQANLRSINQEIINRQQNQATTIPVKAEAASAE